MIVGHGDDDDLILLPFRTGKFMRRGDRFYIKLHPADVVEFHAAVESQLQRVEYLIGHILKQHHRAGRGLFRLLFEKIHRLFVNRGIRKYRHISYRSTAVQRM